MFTEGRVRNSADLEVSNLTTDENRVRSIFVRFRTKVRFDVWLDEDFVQAAAKRYWEREPKVRSLA
jgi:hypothetical protein